MTQRNKFVLGSVVFASLLVGVSFFALRPKWVTATRAEVDKVIDPVLLKREPSDPDAEKRYARFAELIKKTKNTQPPYQPGHLPTPAEITEAARRSRTANAEIIKEIRQVLSEGPYRRPTQTLTATGFPFGSERSFAKVLQLLISDETTPVDDRINAIQLGEILTQREFEASRSLIDYLVSVAIASIIETSSRKFLGKEAIPLAAAKRLLSSLPKLEEDAGLSKTIVGEFQSSVYPYLADPEKYAKELAKQVSFQPLQEDKEDSDLPGCYNALWTAKEFSGLAMEELRNAEMPLKKISTPVADRLSKAADSLPEDKSEDKTGFQHWWAKESYRIQMNLIANSFAYYIAPFSDIQAVARNRDEVRAQHRLFRLQIACAIYAAEKGSFPKRLSDLVTAGLVDSVPQDPFGEGPVHYDPVRKIIWSNGFNLTDDGGSELKGTMSRPSDFVVHLQAAKRP